MYIYIYLEFGSQIPNFWIWKWQGFLFLGENLKLRLPFLRSLFWFDLGRPIGTRNVNSIFSPNPRIFSNSLGFSNCVIDSTMKILKIWSFVEHLKFLLPNSLFLIVCVRHCSSRIHYSHLNSSEFTRITFLYSPFWVWIISIKLLTLKYEKIRIWALRALFDNFTMW